MVPNRMGRPRGLTLDQIIDAVLEDGISTFSLPSIARRLGVAHGGLYSYFPDREALVVLVLDRIAREASWPLPSLTWREQLSAVGETFWTICDTYPGYATVALGTEHVSAGFVRAMTPHVNSMHTQGLDIIDATAAVEFIADTALLSSIAAERLGRLQERPEVPEHTIEGFHDPDMWTGRAWYKRHLDVYLDGLETRLMHHGN